MESNDGPDGLFRPVHKTTAAEDIVEQIKGLLRKKRWPVGGRLPAERKLAQELGVSRPTLREALRSLSLIGFLDTRHGSGTTLATGEVILESALELVVLADGIPIAELHEMRETIEVFLAGKAAQRRTTQDLAGMEKSLAGMADSLSDLPRFLEHDFRFHEQVYRAARNVAFDRLMTCLRRSLRSMFEQSATHQTLGLKESQRQHKRIFDAIRLRKVDAARKAMAAHMATAGEEIKAYERAQ